MSAESLKAKVFDITQPLIVMYNEVQDLQDMATAANNSFSDTQIVNMSIQLIINMCNFEKGLIDWYARPTIEHTWLNFQTHFEDSHQTLRKVRGLTMQNTIFQQQANYVTENLLSEIRRDNQSVCDNIKATEAKLFGVIEHFYELSGGDDTPLLQSANSMSSSDSSQLQVVMQTLVEIQEETKELKN